MKYKKAGSNLGIMIVLIIFCTFFLPKILLLFMPFIMGWLLALLAGIPVRFFENRFHIQRKAALLWVLLLVMGGSAVILFLFWGRLTEEVATLMQSLPKIWKNIENDFMVITGKWESVIRYLPKEMGVKVEDLGETIEKEMGTIVGKLSIPTAGAVGSLARKIPDFFLSFFMCLLSAYFFVVEKNRMEEAIKRMFPSAWREKCVLLKQATIDVLIGYLKAQLKIEIWIYGMITIGLLLLGVKYSYFIALPIALLDFLPLFGTGVILLPWGIFMLLRGKYIFALGLGGIWLLTLFMRQILQPKVLGESMGIAPLPTLILLYLGYKIGGITGMLFSVPLGILGLTMDRAGFFDNAKISMKALWQGFENFRSFTREEKRRILGAKNEEKL